ncbi:hypothetical protein Pst134EB_014528 [Puccinia striiformis f. sp. tritici]|nr:hypothetical protein Pst134EB_014528 [Puccinia striiformis f. sp. tritici]
MYSLHFSTRLNPVRQSVVAPGIHSPFLLPHISISSRCKPYCFHVVLPMLQAAHLYLTKSDHAEIQFPICRDTVDTNTPSLLPKPLEKIRSEPKPVKNEPDLESQTSEEEKRVSRKKSNQIMYGK